MTSRDAANVLAWMFIGLGVLPLVAFLVAESLGCSAHPTFSGGMPGLSIPIADAPARHSDGGQP